MMNRLFPRRKSAIERLEERKANVELDIMEQKRKRLIHKPSEDNPRETADEYADRLVARRKRGY